MSKFNSLITKRFRAEKTSKTHPLSDRSSFSGIFQVMPITEEEEAALRKILTDHQETASPIAADLETLKAITSEVKAINNQAIILHGERIKRAKDILKRYRDGAFSTWLAETYGNRQTPYNFLLYYELYTSLAKPVQSMLDEMPKQAIYSLSSRSAPLEQKEEFIRNYKGETKSEILSKLREEFPLPRKDKRQSNTAQSALTSLKKAVKHINSRAFKPSHAEREEVRSLLSTIQYLINE